MRPVTVVAIGGNSLIRSKDKSSFADQLATTAETCRSIADVAEAGHDIVVTHGNGPQVGFILIRSHLARNRLPEVPLDACNAQTQAEIGYMIQQSLDNEFKRRSIGRPVVTLVTQVVVDAADPAFREPSKPVGPFYTKGEAARLEKELGWVLREDAGRGFRRLVPSPRPISVVEMTEVESLLGSGAVVIACGGGGIPVVRDNGTLKGVAAVIDKDLASSLLAGDIGAERLVISTAVEHVCLNYGQANQTPLGFVSALDVKNHLAARQFPAGSMGPKIEAALDFLQRGGKEVVITDPGHLAEAMAGKAGTHITG
ncbi:carbamate kinase [candidate division WOR-3 bacterium]|uniref:Carbamate kinase n=1 Tax=candidate division WOR-3 bacterium TaxID=2052148 RepID=A0A937XGW9_UNCW3|nr:carbamate kinase [candidate division WOR-3 bacterium]